MSPVDDYLTAALSGNRRGAWRLARDLLESGASFEQVVNDLLGPAQHEIGERWYRREATVSDEHLVTGITESALERMGALTLPTEAHRGHIVVCCAEQESHTLPARMFADLLRSRGWSVAFLGAANPPRDVGVFLDRIRPTALVVSCFLPLHFSGVATLTEVAHRYAIPVLVGGRSLERRPHVAARLGSDGEAGDIDAVDGLLQKWSREPPINLTEPSLRLEGIELDGRADDVSAAVSAELMAQWSPLTASDQQLLDRAEDGLAVLIRFAAAAVLVDDPSVFDEHVSWLGPLVATLGLPDGALLAVLDTTATAVAADCPEAAALLTRRAIDLRSNAHDTRDVDPASERR
jgi:methanogenic corrinoid protein MtbC1